MRMCFVWLVAQATSSSRCQPLSQAGTLRATPGKTWEEPMPHAHETCMWLGRQAARTGTYLQLLGLDLQTLQLLSEQSLVILERLVLLDELRALHQLPPHVLVLRLHLRLLLDDLLQVVLRFHQVLPLRLHF
jgi:hypothetical protein